MSDSNYFLRRAAEEVAAAERAASPSAERLHRELASRYLSMIEDAIIASTSQAASRISA